MKTIFDTVALQSANTIPFNKELINVSKIRFPIPINDQSLEQIRVC